MPGLLKDSSITMVTRVPVFLMGMAASIVVARVLGPELKGSYSVLLLILNLAALFSLFGLGAANVFHGARDTTRLPALAGNSCLAAMVFGLVGGLVLQGLTQWPVFQQYLAANGVEVRWLRWLALTLPLVLFLSYVREIVRAAGDILRYNLIFVLHGGVDLAGAIALVWLMGLGLRGAVLAWVLAQVIVSLCVGWLVWHMMRERPRLDARLFWQSFTYGIRLYPGNIAQFLNYRLDVFLVAYYLPSLQVGLYVTAQGLAEKLWELPHAIRTALLHRVAGAKDEREADHMTARACRLVFAGMGVICLLLAAGSHLLLWAAYGSEYVPAAMALVLLMPGIWAMSAGKLLAIHLAGAGRPEIGTYSSLASLVITVALDIVLIPRMGIAGAALASSVSYTLASVFCLAVFLRSSKISVRNVLLVQRDDLVLLLNVLRRRAETRT